MSQYENPYQTPATKFGHDPIASAAALDDRLVFVRNTYVHLMGAIAAFVLIEVIIFGLFGQQLEGIVMPIMSSGISWLVVLGAFMGVSFIADRWAHSGASRKTQYAGLGLYVLAEALIFVPLLFIAQRFGGHGTIMSAGIVTMVVFSGLTGVVFITKADFSFLRYFLWIVGLAAMGLIVCSLVVGFPLGVWFSVAMVVLAAGCILYQTSNIMHHYRTDQHVSASLALFSSVALLFWYVLQIFMASE